MNTSKKSVQQHSRPTLKLLTQKLGGTALDWLFPPSCVSCKAPGYELCPECRAKIKLVEGRLCPTCGVPHLNYANCHLCQQKPPDFTALRSWAIYEGVIQQMIHALKYKHRLSIALPLGQYLANFFDTLGWPIDLIVSVPISPRRQRARGYSQATAIARVFQRHTAIPFNANALGRVKHTPSQVGLTIKARMENVQDVFWAMPSKVKGKRVLVIDDVCTSSATMRSCAAALQQAGAGEVYGLTVARVGFYRETDELLLVDDLPIG